MCLLLFSRGLLWGGLLVGHQGSVLHMKVGTEPMGWPQLIQYPLCWGTAQAVVLYLHTPGSVNNFDMNAL